ncbi:MAG: hypothetical protein IJH12_02500 [Clostridia bacterium]|nr:hypothetical protein [Clostridia bacterium]
MTFQELISIVDEEKRIEEFRNFDNINNMSAFQKMKILATFKEEKNIMEFFKNNYAFDKDVFVYAINSSVISSKLRKKISTDPQYSWLRSKVASQNLSESHIRSILGAYGGDKAALNFFSHSMPYYQKYENIILRLTTTTYDEHAIDRIMQAEKINGADRGKIKRRVEELFNVNDEILQTVDFRLLTDKYMRLGEKITVITMYPQIQEKILSLSNKEFNFLCDSIDYLSKMNMDWIPLVDDLLSNLKEYSNIINNDIGFGLYMKSLKANQDASNSFMKILTIMTEKNKYKYKSFSEMQRAKRGDIINRTLDEEYFKLSDTDKMRQLIFEKVFGQDLKTAKRLNTYFGQDYERTIAATNWSDSEINDYLTNIKGYNPTNSIYQKEFELIKKSNATIKLYIEFSKKVMECNVEKLKEIYELSDSIGEINIPKSVLDTNFRTFFTRLKNKKLYMPKESDKIIVGGEEAYLMPDDCFFEFSSLEAYSKFNSDESTPLMDWNSKKIRNHLICACFGGSKNLSHPPINGICYGFANMDERAVIKSAPYDVGGWTFSKKFEAYRLDDVFKSKFCTPETQLDDTIRRHNEDELERKNYRYEDDSIFKMQPSYTISFVEPPLSSYFNRTLGDEEILTTEVLGGVVDWGKMNDMIHRQSVIEAELSSDPKWKKTIDDAREKGLKKTIVDRTHILIKERVEMDKKEVELLSYTNDDLNDPNKMNRFLQLIREIVVDFDRARSGTIQKEILGWNVADDGSPCSKYGDLVHKELYHKLFSYKVMDDKLGKMEAKFNSLDPDKYKLCMQKMKDVSKEQVDKLEKQFWWYEYDTSHDWYDYYKYASRQISGITYENESVVIQNLLNQNIQGTTIKGGEAVKKAIKEIEQLREYDIPKGEPDWHGRRHINNVVLFSYLLAQNDGKILGDMDLVIQAAKYHDVGRDGVWNGMGPGKRHDKDLIPHAYPSALAAEFYMKKELNSDGTRKYTDSQIALVKVAIEYHEVYEENKNKFNEDVFMGLCKKENVKSEDLERCKLMCIYLKDADALDRTRFFYEDKNVMFYKDLKDNLDIRYLRTDAAIALRDFARSINDRHYENKSGKLYIPDVLDSYSVPNLHISKDWNSVKQEIAQYMLDKDLKFNPSNPKMMTKEDVKSIVKNPKDMSLFCRIRAKVREIINNIRDKFSNSRNDRD